jgi:hypothetical protein
MTSVMAAYWRRTQDAGWQSALPARVWPAAAEATGQRALAARRVRDRPAGESAFALFHMSAGNYEAFGMAAGVFLQ